jgi:heme-degrading monooxygenase HmoA
MNKIIKRIIDWLATTNSLLFVWKIFGKGIKYIVNKLNGSIVFYNDAEKSKVLNLIKEIQAENKMLLENNEAYQLFMAVKRTQKVEGDIAEVGSYMGGSAKLICEAKGNKELYLFDTFEGLPNLSRWDDPAQFQKGNFSSSFNYVENYLKHYPNVYLYKGLFPATSKPIENKRFSFVHLDVDLYEATRASIEFFYPRMMKGAVMISHDYDTPGVSKAFDEFFRDKPEPIIEMSGCQCLIVKV